MGDGGALLTNDTTIAKAARALRNYSQTDHYVHEMSGLNSRMDELHAAIMRDAFLPNLANWTETRRRTAGKYLDQIRHPAIQLPAPPPTTTPAWHLFPVLARENSREDLRRHLEAHGVMTAIHYPRLICDQTALASTSWESLREPVNARKFASSELSLPVHPFLTDNEVEHVIKACNTWNPQEP